MPPKAKPAVPAIPLCGYQERWIADQSRFKIAVKSRRIGFTFATTLEIALDSISRRTRWLIISRTQETAREALKEVKNHFAAMHISGGAAAAIDDRPTDLFFEEMRVKQFVIELPNGSEIVAMTAHPDAARGFGGNVFLDEHGFHRDSEELWKGAAASVLRGHRLLVVSTPHYQTGNFYRLAREAGLVSGHSPQRAQRNPEENNLNVSTLRSSASPAVKSSIWSSHWVDIHTAAPQLHAIGVPGFQDTGAAVAEMRQLAGDEETWNQEFCCQFLSAAEMWIPLELIAAARSPQATLEWNPEFTAEDAEERREEPGFVKNIFPLRSSAPSAVNLFVGADIGRKRDRTAIWIDERVADVAICRGVITLDRTPFERQFEILSQLIAHPRVRRASIDQTGIGMALVERLQTKFGAKVEGITFTGPSKEEMSLRVRRRMEERLDKIPENAPAVERDFAAVKREMTTSGNLRFDAGRTEAGHADIYWAKALADHAADSGATAACYGNDASEPRPEGSGLLRLREIPDRPSVWDTERTPEREGMFG